MIIDALSKGCIDDKTVPLLKAAGAIARDDPAIPNKRIRATMRPDARLVMVRAAS